MDTGLGLKERSGSPRWTKGVRGGHFLAKWEGAEYGGWRRRLPPRPGATMPRPPRPRLLAASSLALAVVGLAPGGASAADGGGSSLNQEQLGWLRTAAVVLVAVVFVSVVGGLLI